MKEFTSDELDDLTILSRSFEGGGVWLMTIEQYRFFIKHPHRKNMDGCLIFTPPEFSGYGTLLGRKIAIVDFEYFGIAKI
jgi:hypothetical protein